MHLGASKNSSRGGFTLVELLVSVAVLVLLVVMIAQLFSSATAVTTLGTKRVDADSQARVLFDRMSVDFSQMVKRPDVDYFLKSPANPQTGPANDQVAFYSTVPGYYPSTGAQSPVSLVGYRVGAAPVRLERFGKGLLWNGVNPSVSPVVFLPLTITTTWPTATNADVDVDYETLGPQVFRFEYYYVLKGSVLPDGTSLPSIVSVVPWDTRVPGHASADGLRDVTAIGVTIAVIDPKSRALVTDDRLAAIAAEMVDFAPTMGPGDLVGQWLAQIQDSGNGLPASATAAMRVYTRHFAIAGGE